MAAARDLRKGVPQVEVARKYGVRPQAVHQWKKRLDAEGLDALRGRPKTGRPVKLSEKQAQQLVKILAAGPEKRGHAVWSSRKVQALIEERFGVQFSANHVPKLLRRLGFRLRMPDRQAMEKDLVGKRAWIESTAADLKKN